MSETNRIDAAGVSLSRAAAPGLVVLRLRAGDTAARGAAAALLGTALPSGPAHPVLGAGLDLYWTAPDALLLDAGDADAARALVERLASGLAGHHAACHALGDARTRFSLAGPAARVLLAKGTGIDLDPRVFAPGMAALTRFAQIPALLVFRGEAAGYALLADRPLETYLWDWLADAARSLAP
jgi:sarcosine oxidase subunit gamma